MPKTINIIGSGFSALSASCYLAQAGYEVHIFEKNDTVGGRARQYKKDGFTFDIGPTWYWMPDVFERFFSRTSEKVLLIFTNWKNWILLTKSILEKMIPWLFLPDSKISIKVLKLLKQEVLKSFGNSSPKHGIITTSPSRTWSTGREFRPSNWSLLQRSRGLDVFFTNISSDVGKDFRNDKLRQILEFPVLFLGAKPSDTPAFYSFMNYADFGLGTWHPKGGMYSVIEGIQQLAESLGVHFHLNSPVNQVILKNNKACGVIVGGKEYHSDIVLSGADYHHSEELLPKKFRQYSEAYWDKNLRPVQPAILRGF